MPRGYRYAVAALVGWLVLCGVKPSPFNAERGHSAQQSTLATHATSVPAPSASASPTVQFTAYPGYDPDPCYHAKDHDTADLCAQWRAAVAAEAAAHEARRATTWSVISTVLSALAVLGLIFTIRQGQNGLRLARLANEAANRENARTTRRAVSSAAETAEALSYAKINADAAAEQIKISQATAMSQLRAYLSLTFIRMSDIRSNQQKITFRLDNRGVTPALNLKHYLGSAITENGERSVVDIRRRNVSDAPVAPNGFYFSAFPTDNSTEYNQRLFTLIDSGTVILEYFGWFEYNDIFDVVHKTHFSVYVGGPHGANLQELPEERGLVIVPHLQETGNDAD